MKIKYCVFLIFIGVFGCKEAYEEPKISLNNYKIENGFKLEIIASEPLLVAPVAVDFDSKGRIWVAEMTGFMSNVEGAGEDSPTGSIKILEDQDQDGFMDHVKIFKDSLVLPRALALVYGGILYAEPPNLWFAEIKNDKPVNLVLVDSLYAAEGNPEHQPNGLMFNIDNWIYNAKSHFRYQRKQGKWIKEPTIYRGQWGISHDNFGRLYYNTNSTQLLGDYILPNRLTRNKYIKPKHTVNKLLTKNQRVYPLHPSYVNRGYAKGILNKDSLLVNVTSACGPEVYRGAVFPRNYNQNVFVCAPEANLVKRNVLEFHGDSTSAKQAWNNKEFLASTDEGFRPVNLSTGPDGSLYIIDMHRGVIQHHAYLSPYLKKKIKERRLDTIVNSGRLLKVTHKDIKTYQVPDLNTISGKQLVGLLKHKNGWVRDHAQHYLVFKQIKNVIPELIELAQNTNNPVAQIHALYVLKELEALTFDLLNRIAEQGGPDVVSHCLILLESFANSYNVNKAKQLLKKLKTRHHPEIDFYLATTIGVWMEFSEESFYPIMLELIKEYKNNPRMDEAILSGLENVLEEILDKIHRDSGLLEHNFYVEMTQMISNRNDKKAHWIFSKTSVNADSRTQGAKLYRKMCSACHGINGNGVQGLAPPLINSEYVSKPIERLGLIVLNGLEGPVHVNGQRYNLGQVMPGLRDNSNISDSDIASIISYVSNAFSNKPEGISAKQVNGLREVISNSGAEFTEEELLKFKEPE